MAEKILKGIKFPGLEDIYIIPEASEVDETLSVSGAPADAKTVGEKIAEIVDSAPETLDTINKLAAALGYDHNFATNIINQIRELEYKIGNALNSLEIIDGQLVKPLYTSVFNNAITINGTGFGANVENDVLLVSGPNASATLENGVCIIRN